MGCPLASARRTQPRSRDPRALLFGFIENRRLRGETPWPAALTSLVTQVVKSLPANPGVMGSIPGSGRSPGEGNGYPLQYSSLENPMARGAWQATVHGVTKNQTRLSACIGKYNLLRASHYLYKLHTHMDNKNFLRHKNKYLNE